MSLLEIKNVSHSFDYPLFDNINFSLSEQETMAITGISGSGKSTLMHVCSTLLKPNKGIVKIFDKDIYNLADKQLINIRRQDIGIIFQTHYLFRGFTANENIELSTLMTKNVINDELIEKLKIKKVINQKVGELSGGQQQRVSIARVLAKKPKIIFADEPTGNLDPTTANEVINILFEYISEVKGALLLVTHDDKLASKCKYKKNLSVNGLIGG
ncbi:MAG: ABC transporter ATP-binding protein [Epsilonproteobacteria bacterium]|nr:ABC transporter ATP-binding protein [Campylobacterota bacterium]